MKIRLEPIILTKTSGPLRVRSEEAEPNTELRFAYLSVKVETECERLGRYAPTHKRSLAAEDVVVK